MSIAMGRAILRILFPPKCEHPHDGQVCTEYRESGATLKHHPSGGPREPPLPPPRWKDSESR